MDKGRRASELMFRVFEEAASAGGEQSPETVDAAPAAGGVPAKRGMWRAAVGWEGPAAASLPCSGQMPRAQRSLGVPVSLL